MPIPYAVIKKLKHLLGTENVHQDGLSLALNSYDCSASSHRPDLVLTITQTAQLPALLALLAQEKIPFIARAAATNHAGSCAAVRGGVVLNLSTLKQLYRVDTSRRFAEVDPGLITADLQTALRPLGFFYAPDPASEQICTLGGNLAQNASGARCMKYGNTADNTLQVEWLTPRGKSLILRHDNPGPDWLGLIAGSEGTLGIIQKMRVKILPRPEAVKTFLVSFPSLEDAVQTVTDLVASGLIPCCVEAMDRITLQAVEQFAHAGYPDGEALLIIELDGSNEQIQHGEQTLQTVCQKNNCQSFITAQTEAQRQQIWQGRRAAYAAMAALAPNVAVGDGTVPRSQLPAALKQVRSIIAAHGVTASLLFHAGDGNFHPQLVFDARFAEQTRNVQKALHEILKTCIDHGGTISGEHGIGVEKRAVMTYQYSRQTLQLFQQIKNALDPDHLANPEKIIPIGFENRARAALPAHTTVQSLQQKIQQHDARHTALLITGAQTQLHTEGTETLCTLSLDQIIDIDMANYTVTAQAGVRVSALLQALQQQHVFANLPAAYAGTLGGLVATKICPEFISQIIGIEALLPNGDFIQYGGKLMKNAAGYNLCRLFTGSWGALGLITQITFRAYAFPVTASLVEKRVAQPDVLFRAVKKQLDPKNIFLSPAFEEDLK